MQFKNKHESILRNYNEIYSSFCMCLILLYLTLRLKNKTKQNSKKIKSNKVKWKSFNLIYELITIKTKRTLASNFEVESLNMLNV